MVLVVSLTLCWLWIEYENALNTSVIEGTAKLVEINKGDNFSKITQKLLEKNIAIQPLWFKFIAYQNKATQKLKAGEYELQPGLTMPEILQTLVSGKPRQYSITFVEGWTFKQILQQIKTHQKIHHTINKIDSIQVMDRLGLGEKHPEGLFFPDTYQFEKNITDLALLKTAYNKMQTTLNQEWKLRDKGLPLTTAYEALILASIIEKETGAAEERAQISGVFVRRLKRGMLLQTDPTVIYGMGDQFDGNIRRKDLKAHTPYNTYVIKGLPPTPIAMPGREAIHAALHPDAGDSLYFVAKGDGSHKFSATLHAHNQAVDQYQRKK